jgi:hypothetical protein
VTASAYRFLPDDSVAPMSMPRQQTVLLDPAGREQATVLEVMEGVCRVYCPCEETEGMTLAFLQSGIVYERIASVVMVPASKP